jgi:UDP-N-acetylglucosamine--N-acetylmuramyl-(pentapeptide) pyrophosphoryl-undecaprenol N-acetylglucosamine transferase
VLGAVRDLSAFGVQILWLTGERDAERIRTALAAETGLSRIVVMPFLEKMEDAYAAADLAVSRSGGTVAELTCAGLPSILVPFPFAAGDHQTENARAMVEQGAALLCADSKAATDLRPMLLDLLRDPKRLAEMAAAARRAQNRKPHEIARGVLSLIPSVATTDETTYKTTRLTTSRR